MSDVAKPISQDRLFGMHSINRLRSMLRLSAVKTSGVCLSSYVGISLAFQGPKALMCVLQEHARSCSASSTDRYVGFVAGSGHSGLVDVGWSVGLVMGFVTSMAS